MSAESTPVTSYPGLEDYLSRLYGATHAQTRIWADAEGRVRGRYFNSTLTSAFQPIRNLDAGKIVGYEGFARSYSDADQGLCIWKLLDHAATDDESVELDRLCRMLHAINFFRQPAAAGADLYLSVHARLLAAVDGGHGTAFSRVLAALDLPREKIVLQLPGNIDHQNWLLRYVADNYRGNGFRIAVNAADAGHALQLAESVRPEVLKLDAREIAHEDSVMRLLDACHASATRVVFKRVENVQTLDTLKWLAARRGQALHAQGYLWELPQASLVAHAARSRVDDATPVRSLQSIAV